MNTSKLRYYYGYVVVIVSFLILTVAWGIHNSFGVFLQPVLVEFGWTRAMTSSAFSLCTFLLGLLGIVAGRLTDKLGPRIVVTVCGLFLGLGYLLISQISAIWQLYIFYGVIIGTGISCGLVPLPSTVARWFVMRRGMMTGIIISGAGVGQMIMPPIAMLLISTYNWRASYIIIGLIALICIIPAAQFLKRDPAQMGLLPYGEREGKKEDLRPSVDGFNLREAVHTTQFWVLCAMQFCHYFFVVTVLVHIVIYAIGLGISAASAANILAINGGGGVMGRIVMGSVADRIGNKRGLMIGFVLMSCAFLLFLAAKKLWLLYLCSIIFGFAYGNQRVLFSPIVAELFGLSSHGTILGITVFVGTIGGAVGPVVAGRIFDVTRSYELAFLMCALLSVTGLVLTLLLKKRCAEGV